MTYLGPNNLELPEAETGPAPFSITPGQPANLQAALVAKVKEGDEVSTDGGLTFDTVELVSRPLLDCAGPTLWVFRYRIIDPLGDFVERGKTLKVRPN